jgi:hypothetical protein
MLIASGFFAGAEVDMMPANDANPRGFNENLRVYTANERILREAGATWFDPPTDADLLSVELREGGVLRELVSTLRRQAGGAPLVLKDPRIGVMLPLWRPIFEALLHPLIVIRNPVEIALSLRIRDETEVPNALAAWEIHMTQLLRQMSGQEVTVVHHRHLLHTPEAACQVVKMVRAQLATRCAQRIDAAAAGAVLDATLIHHSAHASELNARLTRFQHGLWDFLSRLPASTQTLRVPEELVSPTSVARELVGAERGRLAVMADRHKDKHALAQTLEELREAITVRQLLEASLDDERERSRVLAEQLGRVLDSRGWRITAPLRGLKRAAGPPTAHPRD